MNNNISQKLTTGTTAKRSLITEIKEKLKQQNITNIQAYTFDALLYRLFSFLKGYNPHLNEMKPQTLSQLFPFFE